MLRSISIWLALALLAACAMRAPLEPVAFDLRQVSPRHHAAFEQLLSALDTKQNLDAARVLDRLIPRLRQEAESGDEALAVEAEWQLRAAERFLRILQGRERLAALDLQLEIRGGGAESHLVLQVKSRWPGVLILDPGPAIVEQHAILMGPGGEYSELARSRVATELGKMKLAPLELVEVDLGRQPATPIGGALALRETFLLRMGAGGVKEDGEIYPAQDWPEARGSQVLLAGFLPTAVVDPSALLERLEDDNLGMAGLVERAVRISPERYAEALKGMRNLVERATPEMFSRLEPILRWLCSHDPKPSGLQAWRVHLALGH